MIEQFSTFKIKLIQTEPSAPPPIILFKPLYLYLPTNANAPPLLEDHIFLKKKPTETETLAGFLFYLRYLVFQSSIKINRFKSCLCGTLRTELYKSLV